VLGHAQKCHFVSNLDLAIYPGMRCGTAVSWTARSWSRDTLRPIQWYKSLATKQVTRTIGNQQLLRKEAPICCGRSKLPTYGGHDRHREESL
jgi:hypothetical protein